MAGAPDSAAPQGHRRTQSQLHKSPTAKLSAAACERWITLRREGCVLLPKSLAQALGRACGWQCKCFRIRMDQQTAHMAPVPAAESGAPATAQRPRPTLRACRLRTVSQPWKLGRANGPRHRPAATREDTATARGTVLRTLLGLKLQALLVPEKLQGHAHAHGHG
eukprot:COSAG03_NODE_160_length_11366_cov_10.057518_16_plen_165_part_00